MVETSAAENKRIERLWTSFNALVSEYDRCVRWHAMDQAEAFATALKIIDACIGAESGDDLDRATYDRDMIRRLREIALERDVMRRLGLVERPAAPIDEAATA